MESPLDKSIDKYLWDNKTDPDCQGPVSKSDKTSYRKLSWSLDAAT